MIVVDNNNKILTLIIMKNSGVTVLVAEVSCLYFLIIISVIYNKNAQFCNYKNITNNNCKLEFI